MKIRFLEKLPFFILFALWATFHYRVLFLGHTFVLEDSSRFFFPLWKWGAGVWNRGLIPLWNPDAGFGTPYLADPQMDAWYPPLVTLYKLLDPITAFTFLIVGHHLWSLLGFWLFARNRCFSPWISLCGCLVFGFSFNAISLSMAPIMLFTFSWIPWVFWAGERLRKGLPNSFLLLSFALSMQMASGYPIYSYLTILVLGLVWLLSGLWAGGIHKAERKKEAWAVIAAVLTAALFNSAWLLPFKEFGPLSNLADRIELSGSLRWGDLLTFFNPFLNGHPLHSHPETPYSVTIFFAGLPFLVILGWGLSTWVFEKTSLILFTLLIFLSLGESIWIGKWLKVVLPSYDLVVRSGYWIPFVIWSASILVMESGEVLSAIQKYTWRAGFVWMLGVTLGYGMALYLGVPWDLPSFWLSYSFALLAGSVTFFKARPRFLLLALFFSLWPAARSINFTMAKDYYGIKPPLTEKLVKPGRIHHPLGLVDGFLVVGGNSVSDVYQKLKDVMAPNWPLGLGLEETCFINSLFLRSYFKWYGLSAVRQYKGYEKILDYLNVRYALGEKPNGSFKEIGRLSPALGIWENSNPLPKWYSVSGAVGQFPVDFTKECFVSDDSLKGNYDARSVSEIYRTPSRIILEAKGSGRALLVSSETLYPGWMAVIDGKERSLQDVNHGFRGLRLESGEEKAALVYHPTSFRLGCFLSLMVCGFWVGLILKMGHSRYARV